MAMSRQQRRQMARQLAKTGDVQGSIKAMEQRAHKVADETVDKLRKGAVEQAQADMQGQMFVLFLAWAHMYKGYGKKRLEDMARSLNAFCNDMTMESTTVDDLFSVIENDTGINIKALFKKLTEEERVRMAERQKEIERAESGSKAV
jgi:hypothetical protein